jgi:transcriptional antiterminator RfaH
MLSALDPNPAQMEHRMKWVDMPLLRSYIFVRVSQDNYAKVLSTDSVVRFITFENKAVPIPDKQIDTIRLLLNQGAELEVVSKRFEPGDKIVVQAGPFLGLQGELVQYRGKKKVLIRLGSMSESLLVTLPLELLIRDY